MAIGPVQPLFAQLGHFNKVTLTCAAEAARYYRVPELLLDSILEQEGGQVGQAVRNRNGSYDLGPAQINTSWLHRFARFGISAAPIMDDPCTNLYAAAYVLRLDVNHFGGRDWFRATMAYNVGVHGWADPTRYRIAYYYAYAVVRRWWGLYDTVERRRAAR
ncbi:MAG: lytic transglycosylase domain-containing protein [Terriglobia bacterium]|nr:lytic transglycosylase domain-containing protein [Terriglobia bacterium]